jgi:hypothetical protein
MSLDEILLNEMIKIINKIKENQYDKLQEQGYLKHVSKDEIIEELKSYGGIITNVSNNDYKKSLQYMNIDNINKYKVFLDFWINNERSDLTLVCDILLDHNMNILKAAIEEIHVL